MLCGGMQDVLSTTIFFLGGRTLCSLTVPATLNKSKHGSMGYMAKKTFHGCNRLHCHNGLVSCFAFCWQCCAHLNVQLLN